MTMVPDRRSVLTGLGALPLVGCGVSVHFEYPFDLAELETRNGGRLGLAALDTATGRRVGWRADERFVYCSTFKMFLAAAILVRIQDGHETLDRLIPVTAADMINHAPVTEPAIGSSLSVDRLMQAVVEVSDNPAANLLLKAGGGLEAMRAFYRTLGDDSTRVDRFEPEMNRLDGDRDTILPARSVSNLQRLFQDPASPLTASSQDRLLGWMANAPFGSGRIKAGVPAGWRVAHKTGTGGYGPTNDIGLLYPPTGQPVIVAAYYHGTPTTSGAANDAVIAEATRLALAALGHGMTA